MSKFQFDPISPVQMSPALQSRAVTSRSPLTKSSGYFDSGDSQGSPDMSSGGAVFGFIGSMVASILNYFSQKKLQEKQQQFQKDYFDYTFGKQSEEKWKEIYYNDPWRQMQRFRDAGLNENLLYGSLGNVSGAAGNAPANNPSGLSGSIPTASPFFDFASPIQALLNPLQAMSQISLNRSQTYKNFASAGVDKEQAKRLSLLTPKEMMQYEAMIDQIDQATAKMYAEVEGIAMDNYVKDMTKTTLVAIQEKSLERLNAEIFGIRNKGHYDAAAAARMRKETSLVLPALARSHNASAAEKFAIAKQYTETLDDIKRQYAAKANVSEAQAENYFYTEVLPTYLNLGVDVTEMLITRGLKVRGMNEQAKGRHGQRSSTTERYDSNGTYMGSTILNEIF